LKREMSLPAMVRATTRHNLGFRVLGFRVLGFRVWGLG